LSAILTIFGSTLSAAAAEQIQNPPQSPPAGSVAQQRAPQADESTQLPPVRVFRLPARVGVASETQLTLEQVLSMALANNKDIESSRVDRLEALYNLSSAQGAFDPRLDMTSRWLQQIVPVASSLGGSATGSVLSKTWLTDPTITQAVPWYGGTFRTDYSSARTSSNNTFNILNPQFPTSFNFSYTQPLWRNLLYDSNRHQIDVVKKNRSLTDEQFRQRVMAVITQAEQAYWELAYGYNNLQVQLEAVRLGGQQDESNRRQQEQGLLAPIDVVAAQTQLATFEVSAYAAQAALTRAENNLKALILPGRTNPLWSSALIPISPLRLNPPAAPLADALTEALANRPEAAEVQLSSELNEKDVRFFREQSKPQVDVAASYTSVGLAGKQLPPAPNPFTAGFGPLVQRLNDLSLEAGLPPVPSISFGSAGAPPLLVGGYGQSFSNLVNTNFPTMQVELRVSLPIRNRVAEANLNRSVAETRRIRNQREQVEQAIEADVRNSIEAMQMAQLRLEAAQVARLSAEEQYASEQRQFQAGTSTLFLVQQRQTTMITARSQERRSEADLSEAIATFELSRGSILRDRNINLQ
jgi:HAE1 family hydrophobic/amphiphilic exporter-1